MSKEMMVRDYEVKTNENRDLKHILEEERIDLIRVREQNEAILHKMAIMEEETHHLRSENSRLGG
jgi:hypothetical protein